MSRFGSYCTIRNGSDVQQCYSYQKEGEFCDGQAYTCADSLYCGVNATIGRSCQSISFAAAGESCQVDTDCSQLYDKTPVMVCTNSVCTLKAGEPCAFDYGCPFNTYCKNPSSPQAACVATLGLGDQCTSTQICSTGLICSPTADGQKSLCSKPFTKTEGQKCSGDNRLYGDVSIPITDCKVSDGLYCNDGVCKLQQQSPSSFNCTDSKCYYSGGGHETCVCESFDNPTGICQLTENLDQECQDSLQDIIDCAIANECRDDVFAQYSASSCLFKNCNRQMCNNKCQADTHQFDPETCGGANLPPFPACKSSSSFVKPSMLTIATLLMTIIVVSIL
eukprot:gene5287-6129_t